MPSESLLQVLVRRDGITVAEARDQIAEARAEVLAGADPEDVLYDMGLEPDYIYDLFP
jgi:hypothetical protein